MLRDFYWHESCVSYSVTLSESFEAVFFANRPDIAPACAVPPGRHRGTARGLELQVYSIGICISLLLMPGISGILVPSVRISGSAEGGEEIGRCK